MGVIGANLGASEVYSLPLGICHGGGLRMELSGMRSYTEQESKGGCSEGEVTGMKPVVRGSSDH